ncbi:Rubrofusarin-specific efflux pump aurT [Colletotrichum sidae]|uniref:Rubrofusarin-specific efflux pump aurT n=1 Tax=Colletotrichum sidae TaxID=1347389 RepID=A0A4R8TFN2_9PEZI|nr:Rubrofusarin-specific efflux pump aurT [Colletotrichum sidae]
MKLSKIEGQDAVRKMSQFRLVCTMASVLLVWFIVALDRLIIATAIPAITDEFNSLADIGWYGSAYLLTSTAFLMLYCKVYSLFSIKTSFLAAVVLFSGGSALCAASKTSAVFIFGRMVSGLGSAGIGMGAQVMMVHAVPITHLPHYMGAAGAVFAIASVVGPVVGGALTTYASWRWCFWINLPVAAVCIVAIWYLFENPPMPSDKMKLKDKIAKFDVWGNVVLAPACVCLVLALQWGGIKYPWNDGRVIVLLIVAAALFVVFLLIQVRWPEKATISPTVFKQRSVFFGFLSQFFISGSQTLFVFYLPIWFQVVQGVSAVDSGTRILPLLGGLVTATTISGFMVNKVSYYLAPMALGAVFMSVGAGLLTTLNIHTPTSAWIGYQVLYGWGTGLVVQAPMLAAKACLPKTDVSIGLGLMRLSASLGGLALLAPAAAILNGRLLSRLSHVLPGSSGATLASTGITDILAALPPQQKPIVIDAYNESIRETFFLGLASTLLVFVGPLGMEWVDMKVKIREEQEAERASADAEAVPYEKRNQEGREFASDNMESIEERDVDDDEPSAPLLTREHRYSEEEMRVHQSPRS